MNKAVEENPFPPSPFKEVPTSDFEKIRLFQSNFEVARSIFDTYEEKPIVAQMIAEYLVNPETPAEVKMEAFKSAYDLIDNPGQKDTNVEIAKTLIDMIRTQSDPGMRLRLISIISHEAQDKYFDFQNNEFGSKEYRQFDAKRSVLQILSESGELPYKMWARMLTNPRQGGVVELYNGIYSRNMDLSITPRIIEEVSLETDDVEGPGENRVTREGGLVKLKPPFLPSAEKMKSYKEATGRELPFFIVRKVGAKLFSVEFPSELQEKMRGAILRFRKGEISRSQVFELGSDLGIEFLDMMNEGQRDQFLDPEVNIEIRFATERVPVEEKSPAEPIEELVHA